eukprot:COSAG01_NODE_7646_length_3115_cov_2.441976_3_plen_70_part_00
MPPAYHGNIDYHRGRAQVFRRAREATNPYECLGTGPFVCRSALKLVGACAIHARALGRRAEGIACTARQ